MQKTIDNQNKTAFMSKKKQLGKKLRAIRLKQGHKAGTIERVTNRKLRCDQIKSIETGEDNYTIDTLINYTDFLGLNIEV
jgi:hypothetical protein